MTPRTSKRVSVDKSKFPDYRQLADQFSSGAESEISLENWSAAALLIVHAAIAYTDALTIKIGGVKCQGDDHMAAVDLAREVVVLDEQGEKALNHLWRIIQEKNAVSYYGDSCTKDQADKLWKHLGRYKSWVVSVLGS